MSKIHKNDCIAIMIKTYLRDSIFEQCIYHIKKNITDVHYRIYVCDDGTINTEKENFYKELEDNGHFVLRLPYNVGANPGRIALLPYIKEDYILRMDDDFFVTEETKLKKMLVLLKSNSKFGAISGLERQLSDNKGVKNNEIRKYDGQGYIIRIGKTIFKKFVDYQKIDYNIYENIRYKEVDFGRNFILFKKQILEEIIWDYRLKFAGEHLDFLLQFKKNKNYKLIFTPESIHVHAGPEPSKLENSYKVIRFSNEFKKNKYRIFESKWKIKYFASFHQDDSLMKKLTVLIKAILKGYYGSKR